MQTNNTELKLETFPILHTGRLGLIEIKQSHLTDLYKLFSDENVTRFYNLLPFQNEKRRRNTSILSPVGVPFFNQLSNRELVPPSGLLTSSYH